MPSLRWHDPDQVRRSKVENLPLSPAHRTPVFADEYTPTVHCRGACVVICRFSARARLAVPFEPARYQCLSERMTALSALPVTQTSGVATRSSPMMLGSNRTPLGLPTYAPRGMDTPPPPPPLPSPCR